MNPLRIRQIVQIFIHQPESIKTITVSSSVIQIEEVTCICTGFARFHIDS